MDRLLRTVLSIKEVKTRHDDDFVDRLTRSYTTTLLVTLSFIVTTRSYVGDPIACWCPAHFTESHRQYTNTICWVSNTYYLPFDRRIPAPHELNRIPRMISYYQWVPLVLLCQAMCCYLPCMLWRFMNVRSGLDVSAMMDAAIVCKRASYNEIRERTVRYMVNQIDRHLLSQRDYRGGCCNKIKQILAKYCLLVGGKRSGNFLTLVYLFTKCMYILNSVGMLFLMDVFLGIEYHVYGILVMARLVRGEDWSTSVRFPRVTLCNFQIRHQGARLHDYVVQCTLTINLFNEKIFVFLWFWYVFVATVTILSFMQWIARCVYWPAQVHYVKRKLRSYDVNHRTKATMIRFTQYYLRRDGMFIIRLLSMNVGEMVASETLKGLWENYGPDKRMISEHPERSRRSAVSSAPPAGPSGHHGNMEVV